MHCYCVDGTLVKEVSEFEERLADHGLGGAYLNQYMQLWRWPNAYAHARQVFRKHADHSPAGSASEYLSLCPVLAQYVRGVVMKKGVLGKESASFLALAHVMELLQMANSGDVQADELARAIHAHLVLHQAAYGFKLWKAKEHYNLHIPSQLQLHGMIISTFLHERKHRVLKRVMTPRHSLTAFDRSVLEEATVQHLYDLGRHNLAKPDLINL
eukprot:9492860-Pyramimonas_sp.AAC.1